jgi:chromosome partitioning protein
MAADLAILPCGPSAADAWALAASLEVLEEARTVRPDLRALLVLTRLQVGTVLERQAREALEETGVPVAKTKIHYRVAFQEALAAGQGVTTYAPRDAAGVEMRTLFDEVTKGLRNEKTTRSKTEKASKGTRTGRG